MILTPNERSFYLAPDDISFFNIITVPFDTEPPPTDDLLDAVSEEVSSLVSAPRKNSILHIFVSRNGCPWGNPWVLEKGGNRSEQDLGYKAGAVMSGVLNDLKPCECPNLCEGERCRDGWWCFSRSFWTVRVWFTQNFWNKATPWILRNMWIHWRNWKRGCDG